MPDSSHATAKIIFTKQIKKKDNNSEEKYAKTGGAKIVPIKIENKMAATTKISSIFD